MGEILCSRMKAKQFDRLRRLLPLVDQRCGQILNAEPQGVYAGLTCEREQVAVLERVELRRFGRKANWLAKRPIAHGGTGHRGEQRLGGLATIEEIVVRAEEVFDVEALGDHGDRPGQAFRAAMAPTLLIDGGNRTIGAV